MKNNKRVGKTYIGTSGWLYKDWGKRFYPKNLPDQETLPYLARFFSTVEINTTFYHLPSIKMVDRWRSITPPSFIFSTKVSRYITHQLQLVRPARPLKRLLSHMHHLKNKLGPLLIQFPPSFEASPLNVKKLQHFIKLLTRDKHRVACELRHESWFHEEVYELLSKHNVALVISNSPSFPHHTMLTANFIYVRYHGSKTLFSSNYSDKELQNFAKAILGWNEKGLDVYAYFNNDRRGFAVFNALRLQELLQK